MKIAEVRASRFVDTTSANAMPTTVAASELQEDILREVAPAAAGYGLLTNPSLERADQSDTDRPQGWRPFDTDTDESELTRVAFDNRIAIALAGTDVVSAGSVMIQIRDDDEYRVRVRVRGSGAETGTLTVRVNQLTTSTPASGETHIDPTAVSPWRVARSSSVDLAAAQNWAAMWTDLEYTYSLATGVRYASFGVLKLATSGITGYVEHFIVERIQQTNDYGRVMPDYDRRREDLRQRGVSLVW